MRFRALILVLVGAVCAALLWFTLQTRRARTAADTRLDAARGQQVKLGAALQRAEKTVVPPPVAAKMEPPPASASPPKPSAWGAGYLSPAAISAFDILKLKFYALDLR